MGEPIGWNATVLDGATEGLTSTSSGMVPNSQDLFVRIEEKDQNNSDPRLVFFPSHSSYMYTARGMWIPTSTEENVCAYVLYTCV